MIVVAVVCGVALLLIVAVVFYLYTVGKFRKSLEELDVVQTKKMAERKSTRRKKPGSDSELPLVSPSRHSSIKDDAWASAAQSSRKSVH
mgnify:CR=1 FL=1